MSTEETASNVSTFHNENLNVEMTKNPRCQVKFDIKVQPHAVEAAYRKTIKNINKEVSIPGFRKGRAPEAMIIEKYSSVIQKEFVDLVLQTGFNEAIQLTHVHLLKDGDISRPVVHTCSYEKGAHFTIEFETRPTLPSVKVEDLQIAEMKQPIPVTDKERKNALHNLLLRFATYDPIEDRPVQEEDFVNISVLFLGDSPQEVIKNQQTQVNADGLPGWLRQKIIGLRAEESAEGMTEQDPNLIEQDPHFISRPFRVTVHSIWQGHLPAIDEELAKRVGLQSVEELYQKIDERLEQESEEEAFEANVQAIEKLLVEKYPIDLPQSYIDTNKKARLDHYLKHLEEQGESCSKEDYQTIEKSVEQNTIFDLQLFFLSRKVAADYGITVDNQEISEELSRQLSLMLSKRSHIDFTDKEKLHQQLQNLALDRKIKQFLVDHVTVVRE